MKNLFIAAILVVATTASAFAKDVTGRENEKSKINFNFKNATNVKWTTTQEYTKAAFELYDSKMEVFYNNDGEMIAKSVQVSVDDMPLSAKRSIAKKFNDYTISEVIKMETTEDGAYYVSAENDKEKLILQVSEAGLVSVFNKTAK